MNLTEAEVLALATLFSTPHAKVPQAMSSQAIAAAVARVVAQANDIMHESRSSRR